LLLTPLGNGGFAGSRVVFCSLCRESRECVFIIIMITSVLCLVFV